MRGKRSKQYRKLMTQYSQIWGFREPYQCLVDAGMVVDCHNFRYDLIAGLKRTLHGEVKPMISQCEIRKLYARKSEPEMDRIIDFAKTIERRRCGHLPEDYPEPLSTMDCFKAVVDPKNNGVNKHKLVVACQDDDVRRALRSIPGVPQIYIKRSVMILEPMASQSVEVRAREEKGKYRAGLTAKPVPGTGKKRKREEEEGQGSGDEDDRLPEEADVDGDAKMGDPSDPKSPKKPKKKGRGPKGPNPLAVKKPKNINSSKMDGKYKGKEMSSSKPKDTDAPAKKKRKRKHKPKETATAAGESSAAPVSAPASVSAEA